MLNLSGVRAFLSIVLMPLLAGWVVTAGISEAREKGSTRAAGFGYVKPEETVIGTEQLYVIQGGESLYEVAREYGLGIDELTRANPGVDPWIPLKGTPVRMPTQWILPDTSDEGIVINLAEPRLYYFFQASGIKMVITFPIGIGRIGHESPTGVYTVVEKLTNPSWYPPPSARAENPLYPKVIPPGPENPLGEYWLGLSLPGYGIHGTNRPWSLGRDVTRGCIRMYPEDIQWLFEKVPAGTRVEIVRQPIKVGRRNQKVYVELDGQETDEHILTQETFQILKQHGKAYQEVDPNSFHRAMRSRFGLPIRVSD